MKRTGPVLLTACLAAAFLTSCKDEPGPTDPVNGITPSMQLMEADGQAFIDAVDRLIENLFPQPGLLNSAQKRWRNIQRQKPRALWAAQQQALALISDAVGLLDEGRLLDPGLPEAPTALLGVNVLSQYLFDFTGLVDPPVFGDDYFDARDKGTGWITPADGGTIETDNGWARLTVGPGESEDNVLVTIELLDEDVCDPTSPLKTALGCWDFDLHGAEDTGFERTVEICVADPGEDVLTDQEYYAELRVHEQEEDSDVATALPYVNSTLDCSDFPVGEETVASASPDEDASLLATIGSRVADLLLPDPLAAFFQTFKRPPRGIGGVAGSFTWFFGAVPETGAEYDPGLVGTGPDAESWAMYAPAEPVSLCNRPDGVGCPESSVESVVVSAVAETGTDAELPPWSSVYFYYKAYDSSGPITYIGTMDEPTDYGDDGFSRHWTWEITVIGEDIPDIGQIDVFAVGVQNPNDGGGVFATNLNSNIIVNSYEPDLVGDQDGFGMDLVVGDKRPTSPDPYFDNREGGDPSFTDVMPASVDFTYTHAFPVPAGMTVSSATLRWLTLGIQDGDSEVTGSDTDIRLYLDGAEVAGAFDEVDQFELIEGEWVEIVGLVEIPLTGLILDEFLDGEVDVRIEITQLGSTGPDAIAIDYSELVVEYGVGGL
jgi:hypothetical protein